MLAMPVTVSSAKKNGPYTIWLKTAQNTLTLGESCWCSTQACGFSDPHILTLRRFTAPPTWNVASSLNCTFSWKWSPELTKSCNCKQKSSRRLWSSSYNCTVWMRYGSNTERVCRTLHTLVFDIDSSLVAFPVDFFGLCRKLARTCSTSSSAVNGWPLDFCLHRHPVSVNCLYHTRMVFICRRVFCVLCTKCTLHRVTTDLLCDIPTHKNDFYPGAAIFSVHTLASPSGRNVNYDEKELTGRKIFELFLLSVQVS
jgi:hypothetical protein